MCRNRVLAGPFSSRPAFRQLQPHQRRRRRAIAASVHANTVDWRTASFPYNLAGAGDAGCPTAQRDSCQWFNAQCDTLISQAELPRRILDAARVWSAPGVQAAADVLAANLDQSAAFLDPACARWHITNYPDQARYSPLYNGDSIFHLWYQR